jgi:hypothetical protein
MPNFSSQIRAQSFIQRMVAKGEYQYWMSGIVNSKAELDAKHKIFAEAFGTDLSPSAKLYRRKKKGLANTTWVSAPLPVFENEGGYIYFLLATDGIGEIRKNSKLQDAWSQSQRLTWGDYVLFPAARHRLQGGGVRWSWYIKKEKQRVLEFYCHRCVLDKNSFELRSFFEDDLLRRPLHHGVRDFVKRLLKHSHHDWMKLWPGFKWPARDPNLPLPFINGFKSDKPKED